MKKVAVLYKSQYGATKLYADKIAQQLNADIFDIDKLPAQQLKPYDTIIWGGGIYAGSINGLSKIKRHLADLKGKQIIVFSVGFTPVNKLQMLQKVRDHSLHPSIQEGISFFHFVSGINYEKLSPLHRAMLAGKKLTQSFKTKASLSPSNKEFLKTYGKNNQTIDEAAIKPLISAVSTQADG